MKSKWKNLFIYIGIVLGLLILGSLSAAMFCRTGLFSFIDVFFYRGIALILFCGLLSAIILAVLRCLLFRNFFLRRDIAWFFILFCAINIVFFTHVPVTADRSITVFMLGYLADNSDRSFSKEEMEDFFIERYVHEFGAFDKRFQEQIETGTIAETAPGEYRITASGIQLMQIYEKTAKLYRIEEKLIHPDDTDKE